MLVAGARAVEKVFGVQPDLTREGGSIPVTLTFQDALDKNVLLLPMGACDDVPFSSYLYALNREPIQSTKSWTDPILCRELNCWALIYMNWLTNKLHFMKTIQDVPQQFVSTRHSLHTLVLACS